MIDPRPLPPAADPFALTAEPESDFHLVDYLRIVTSRWRLLLVLTALTLTVALLQYAVTPKAYRAAALIQIERSSPVPVRGVEDAWMESWWNAEYYPTQYQLLRSRGLAERAVLAMHLDQDASFNPGGPAAIRRAADGVTAADDDAALAGLAGKIQGGLGVAPLANTQLVEISYVSESPELAAERRQRRHRRLHRLGHREPDQPRGQGVDLLRPADRGAQAGDHRQGSAAPGLQPAHPTSSRSTRPATSPCSGSRRSTRTTSRRSRTASTRKRGCASWSRRPTTTPPTCSTTRWSSSSAASWPISSGSTPPS